MTCKCKNDDGTLSDICNGTCKHRSPSIQFKNREIKIEINIEDYQIEPFVFTFDKGYFSPIMDAPGAYERWENSPPEKLYFYNAWELLHHSKITKFKNKRFIRFWMDANWLNCSYWSIYSDQCYSPGEEYISNISIGFVPNNFANEMNIELSKSLTEYINLNPERKRL